MSIKEIIALNEPFIYSELLKRGISTNTNTLEKLVDQGTLQRKKIGRMNIYWKKEPTIENYPRGLESHIKQLELENRELKHELQAEREKVRKLSIQDGIDEPWKEAAMAMARILSEQKQVSLKEVLEYFNAPVESDIDF
ncbi:hypothetical protein [Candidatus Hodarchaeum mangrovi]